MCRLSLNEKWGLLWILIHHSQRCHKIPNAPISLILVTWTFFILAAFTVIATWNVPPAGVVELPAEILAESRQVRLPVWHLIQVWRVEQHLGIGGAARTLDLLQQTSTFGVVGGENLRTTHNKDCWLKWWAVQTSPQRCHRLCNGEGDIFKIFIIINPKIKTLSKIFKRKNEPTQTKYPLWGNY